MRKLIFIITIGFTMGACSEKEEIQENIEAHITDFTLSSVGIESKSPYITSDQKGTPVASWVEGEDEDTYLFYARWDNKEKCFGNRLKVEVTKGLAAHHESMPKIAFKEDGTAYVVYQIKKSSQENRFASALYYSFSKDEQQWSKPKYLHSDTTEGIGRSFFDLALLPDGEIGAIWLDGRKKQRNGSTLMFSKTAENGSFQKDAEIAQKTCQCCRTDIYIDDKNAINVAFRDIINDTIRDMVYLKSNDNGRTFSDPARISEDNWVLDGCPHTGPSMASNSNGLHFFWFTAGGGEGVYTTTLNGGRNFAKRSLFSPHARHPQAITTKSDDVVLVWDETFKTDSTYLDRIGIKIGDDSKRYISNGKTNSDHPVVAELKSGKIVVVWTELDESNTSVKYSVMLN